MNQHTPEPWTIDDCNPADEILIEDPLGELIAIVPRIRPLDVLDANVRVIACAPKLLRAAKLEEEASKHWDGCSLCLPDSGCNLHQNMRRDAEIVRRQAIAEAEGR